jgi:hypothetical protein
MFVFFALYERKKDKREKRKYRSAEGKEAPTAKALIDYNTFGGAHNWIARLNHVAVRQSLQKAYELRT